MHELLDDGALRRAQSLKRPQNAVDIGRCATCRVRDVEAKSVVDLPYDERRIIVVTDKIPSRVAKPRASGVDVALASAAVVAGAVYPKIGGRWTVDGMFVIVQAVKDFRKGGEAIYPISFQAARGLRFPPGHARRNVVYVGHPVDAGSYIPAADFHRFLFQHKVAEALRLVRSLGAVEVKMTHLDGWDKDAAARIGLSIPTGTPGANVEVSADANRADKKSHQILTEMKLAPSREPHVPDDLVWTPHEPLWQEVANARMESGLDKFVIDVQSVDDFGVNAGLKTLIGKTKLDAGGKFVEHQNTTWRLEGTFS